MASSTLSSPVADVRRQIFNTTDSDILHIIIDLLPTNYERILLLLELHQDHLLVGFLLRADCKISTNTLLGRRLILAVVPGALQAWNIAANADARRGVLDLHLIKHDPSHQAAVRGFLRDFVSRVQSIQFGIAVR
jgi:hypothetical protein